jgi:hypothetical protein
MCIQDAQKCFNDVEGTEEFGKVVFSFVERWGGTIATVLLIDDRVTE